MKLKCESSASFYKLSDREKRNAIDQELRKEKPDWSDAQIREMREQYIKEHYGSRHHLDLPQPEARQIHPRVLTLTEIASDIANAGASGFGRTVMLFLILGLPIFVLTALAFVSPALLTPFLVFIMILLYVVLIASVIWEWRSNKKARAETYRKIMNGECIIKRNTIADMYISKEIGSEYEAVANCKLDLKWQDDREEWYCDIKKEQYEELREGDTLYTIHLDDGKPVCLIHPDAWIPDDQLKRFLGIS